MQRMKVIVLGTIAFFGALFLSVQDKAVVQAANLSVSVSYTAPIKCGTPTEFTLNAAGGSGSYQYRLAALMVYDGSEWVSVYDTSYGSNMNYQDSNKFSFTFYASGTYYIRFTVRDKVTYQYKNTGLFEYPLVISDAAYPSVEQKVALIAAQCEQECSTDFEKALWLHDWLLDHADYDYSYSYCSAEGVLARGTGTCESYHRAYVMLLNKVGIATGRVEGNGHVWTAVQMDGEWYQVDSTWDDMGAGLKGTYYEHVYFGLTDYIIGLVHSDHTAAVPGYESTALEDNYFIKTGKITQWSDPYVDTIRTNLAAGNTSFAIPVVTSMPANYKNVIYNLVAYQLANKESWGDISLTVSYADDLLSCSVVQPTPTQTPTQTTTPTPTPATTPTPTPTTTPKPTQTTTPTPAQTTTPTPTTTPESTSVPVYRLYCPVNGEHLYTLDYNEVTTLSGAYGWDYEGIAWYAPDSGTAVYRLYNPELRNHLYTTDTNEVQVLTASHGWQADNNGKPVFYSGGTVPIYRVYNEGLSGMHHLTSDYNEYITLPAYGWSQEGIKLYAIK
jgi:hypothetical protein